MCWGNYPYKLLQQQTPELPKLCVSWWGDLEWGWMCGLVPVDSNSCFALGLRCFGSWLRMMSPGEPKSKEMMLAALVEFRRVGMGKDANTLQMKLSSRNWATVCPSPWILFSAFRLGHSVFFLGFWCIFQIYALLRLPRQMWACWYQGSWTLTSGLEVWGRTQR